MNAEKTPEEQGRTKRAHANSMIAMGAVTTACALAAGMIALSGRGDLPGWMFGGGRVSRATSSRWTDRPSLVDFREWGAAAFTRARKENKLVLLFLGPSYNEATLRTLAETFGDPAAAALANARFVPVRVRSEEYPDLDRRYRARGWPTTALLLPDGVVLDAGDWMAPELFRRWAGALADKAAGHPDLLRRIDDARRREEAAPLLTAPITAADAENLAREKLFAEWEPARRTFDREGPRFPRWERIAALERLGAPWARDLAAQALKGALIFQDPVDGGFRRSADPEGRPAAREKTISDQAAALDALCAAAPNAARRELDFLDRRMRARVSSVAGGAPGWLGWRADPRLGPPRRARLGEEADLSRAVLECAAASSAQKAYAMGVIVRVRDDFQSAARRGDSRLLLDDAVAVGSALSAAGDRKGSRFILGWMDKNLWGGPYYWDRLPTGLLPPETDRLADPALNGKALRFLRALDGNRSERAERLAAWLGEREAALDPAVAAVLLGAASETGGGFRH